MQKKIRFEHFHGADMVGLDGTTTLLQIANLIASGYRGETRRRNRLLPKVMRDLVFEDNDGTLGVRYLEFADHLGKRTTCNGVLLREISREHIVRVVRRDIHGLRRKGLDVNLTLHTRQGLHDVMLIIKPSFVHKDETIPSYMKKESENHPVSMREILELGEQAKKRAG